MATKGKERETSNVGLQPFSERGGGKTGTPKGRYLEKPKTRSKIGDRDEMGGAYLYRKNTWGP